MRIRARLQAKGWDGDLVVEEVPESEAAQPVRDQVLVRVAACGVCHRDCIDRDGRFKFMRVPITPGHEAVGRVEAVGPEVTTWQVGDRVATLHREHCGRCGACRRGDADLCAQATAVLGLIIDGGYATHLVVPQTALYRVGAFLPDEVAAPLHCTYGTAYRGLTRFGPLDSSQTVLITGANGGVGSAAIQVAHALGAKVIAVVRDPEAEVFVSSLGADRVIVDPGDGFHKTVKKSADLVLDNVGEPTFNAALRSLRPGGRMVVIGNLTEARAQLNLGYIILNSIEIAGSRGAGTSHMAELLELHQTQPWTFPVPQVLPLAEADRAQRLVREGVLRGRVVLTMPS